MVDARGFSNLYPVVPIMNVISMVLCLLLIPGFWKTRIVALITLVVWIFLANLMNFVGMIQWRGNTNDVPIWAAFLAVLRPIWCIGWLASTVCFAHFTWRRLQPLSIRKLYDNRRRNNRIYFVVSVIIPFLWGPLFLVSCPYRYVIIEDVGPVTSVRLDWPGFVLLWVPQLLSYLAVFLFNTLALVTYWRMKWGDIESELLKDYSSVRTRKLLLLALSNTLLAAYGISRPVRGWLKVELVAPRSLAENIASLQSVSRETRSIVEEEDDKELIDKVIAKFAIPLLGFYLFVWFGCGAEARRAYREALMKLVRLMGLAIEEHQPYVGPSPFPWSWIALQSSKLPRGLDYSLSTTRLNAPQLTPYISAVPRGNDPEPSATPANNPFSPVGNVIDTGRQGKAPSREPARRLSIHKPPLATLNPADATSSAANIPLRHLSYHKPPFVPLVPLDVSAIAVPGASGSVASRVEGMDSTRRQENFATRAPAQRFSYHKPAFVALVPANAGAGAIAHGFGQTVPLVEAPRDLISGMNARLRVESALDSPPPFSSPSTAAAPPLSDVSISTAVTSLSTPSTRTPAPPYQHLNPFPDHVA